MPRIYMSIFPIFFLAIAISFQVPASETFSQNSTVTAPHALEDGPLAIKSQAPLAYPEEAKIKGFYAVVTVEVEVDTDGVVKDAKIISSPNEKLSVAVLNAVKLWKYKPVIKNGHAISSKIQHDIVFKSDET